MKSASIRNRNLKSARFNVIDTETTGLSTSCDRFVEIWVGKYRGDGKREMEFLKRVRPNCPIDADAQRLHGITKEMLKDEPLFREIADELVEFIGNDPIVHHCSLDIQILNNELKRARRPRLGNLTIDLHALAKRQFGYKKNRLEDLVNRFELRNKPRHTGRSDGMATAAVFFRMTRIFERQWELSIGDIVDLREGKRTPSAGRNPKKIRRPFPR